MSTERPTSSQDPANEQFQSFERLAGLFALKPETLTGGHLLDLIPSDVLAARYGERFRDALVVGSEPTYNPVDGGHFSSVTLLVAPDVGGEGLKEALQVAVTKHLVDHRHDASDTLRTMVAGGSDINLEICAEQIDPIALWREGVVVVSLGMAHEVVHADLYSVLSSTDPAYAAMQAAFDGSDDE